MGRLKKGKRYLFVNGRMMGGQSGFTAFYRNPKGTLSVETKHGQMDLSKRQAIALRKWLELTEKLD